jgi:hypothetical protein
VSPGDKLDRLIADGVGRRKIAEEFGISEYHARQMMDVRKSKAIDL